MEPKEYDVLIAGTGIAGTTLGSILAKNGLKVLLVELGKHPRFALGEALLPQSAIWPFIIGEYFDIPEIRNLSSADCIVDHITPQCGIKHSIGFAYHEAGLDFQVDKCHQLIPPHMPFYSESHLLREEVDLYLLEAAQGYGCDYVDETKITDVEFSDAHVTLTTSSGTFKGAYFVDSSGRNSLVVEKRGYRKPEVPFETHSRTIFAHVEGLPPFDELIEETPGQTKRLHDGTLHHVFDGGWMWVIPFDNFSRSTSKLASIGLMLDPRKHPERPGHTPEEEFHAIIREFPAVHRHLKDIQPTRPFIRSGRLQYGSNQGVGHRHFLTNNTFGFVDALYSNGLINTFEVVFQGAHLLLDAFKRGGRPEDFAPERFASMEQLLHTQLAQADTMVANAYRAMGSFETWNAWTQFWLGQVLFHDLWLQRACFNYFGSGDRNSFDGFLSEQRPGTEAPFHSDKVCMLKAIEQQLQAFEAGEVHAEEAAIQMLKELEKRDWLPKNVYPWGDSKARHVDFSLESSVGALLNWGKTASPKHIREELFDFELPSA